MNGFLLAGDSILAWPLHLKAFVACLGKSTQKEQFLNMHQPDFPENLTYRRGRSPGQQSPHLPLTGTEGRVLQ